MLLFYLIIFIIAWYIAIKLLYKSQAKTEYLRPGWFLLCLTFFYIGPTTILYIIDEDSILNNFSFYVNYENLLLCLKIFLFSVIGFLFAEFAISNFYSNNFNSIIRVKVRTQNFILQNNKTLNIISLILISIAIYLYFKRWEQVGGFLKMIEIGRAEALFDLQTSNSTFFRYDIPLFLGTSFFFPTLILNPRKKSTITYFIIAELIIMFIVIILSGARLPILSIFILFFCQLYYLKKELLSKRLKKIITLTIISFLCFNTYTYFRSHIWDIITQSNSINTKVSLIQTLFPSETLTALSSLTKMEQDPNIFYDNQFTKFIPNSLRSIFGLDEFIPYSARLQLYTNTRSTLTVPFSIDSYYGLNGSLFLVFLYSFFIYIFLELIIKSLATKTIGLYYISWIQIILYYMMRTESIAWFSRLLLMFFIGIPIILILKLLIKSVYKR